MGDTAMKPWILIVLSTLLCFTAPLMAAAEEPSEKPLLAKPFMKLARGAVNMISAPLEIPNQIYILSDHADKNSPYGVETAAGAIEGLFTGIGFALWRFVVGTYDVITFPVPIYEACLIYPPYITVSYEAYYEKADTALLAEDNGLTPGSEAEGIIPPPETGAEDTTPPAAPENGDATPTPSPEVK
jgi:putative exosortase-associated protein (TIGR04073 family)